MAYSQQRSTETGKEKDTGPISPSHEGHGVERRTPSWFSQPFQSTGADEAAERYRAMRSEVLRGRETPGSSRSSLLDLEINRSFRIEGEILRDRPDQKRAPMAPSRKVLAARPVEAIERARGLNRKVQGKPVATPQGRLPLEYIAAGVAAVLAGGLLGYGATNYKAIGAKADEIAMLVKPAETTVAEDTMTIVAKKTIATATLNVSDVSGELNSLIPLLLHVEPAAAGDDLILKLSGLPQSAYLTAGTKAKDNAWQLAAVDADGVKLVVPQTSEPSFDVAVAAFEANTGQLAAPIKEMTVAIDNPDLRIAPAAALPESVMIKSAEQSQALVAAAVPLPKEQSAEQSQALVAAAVPLPKEHSAEQSQALVVAGIPLPKEQQVASVEPPAEAQNLLAKGDILLKAGDLGMARQFYERAFAEGSVEAAIGAGKTYDPIVYAELKVHGLKPDPVRALEWYTRASAAGNTEAAAAIEALKQSEP